MFFGVGLLGPPKGGFLVASGLLLVECEVGLDGYDLFIRLRSSLVIRPSGGTGEWVDDPPPDLLGEFEAEVVLPIRPLRFNEVGLEEVGLVFDYKKREINFLVEIVLLSKEKYIKSQLFWFTFYFKKVYYLPVTIQFLWEGHYFCHWLVLRAVSEFLDLRTKILRTELRPNYLCLSWMVDQIADKIHDLYLIFSWQDHLE